MAMAMDTDTDDRDLPAVRVRRVTGHDPQALERSLNRLLAELDPSEVIRVGDIVQEETPERDGWRYACTVVFCLRPGTASDGD